MKIYNNTNGAGGLIYRDSGITYNIAPRRFTEVPDKLGELLIKRFPNIISTDSDALVAKAEGAEIRSKLQSAEARIKELEAQIEKLKLIATEIPDAPVEAGKVQPAKRGPKPKAAAE